MNQSLARKRRNNLQKTIELYNIHVLTRSWIYIRKCNRERIDFTYTMPLKWSFLIMEHFSMHIYNEQYYFPSMHMMPFELTMQLQF
jgi:hypothetical protein